jgi:hypothetical protein
MDAMGRRMDMMEHMLVLQICHEFLRMMEPLRVLVDVAQHAAKDLELRLQPRVLRHFREMLQTHQHCRDRAVLILQNAD